MDEFDQLIGTRGRAPRLPLHSLIDSLEARFAGDGLRLLKVGRRIDGARCAQEHSAGRTFLRGATHVEQ